METNVEETVVGSPTLVEPGWFFNPATKEPMITHFQPKCIVEHNTELTILLDQSLSNLLSYGGNYVWAEDYKKYCLSARCLLCKVDITFTKKLRECAKQKVGSYITEVMRKGMVQLLLILESEVKMNDYQATKLFFEKVINGNHTVVPASLKCHKTILYYDSMRQEHSFTHSLSEFQRLIKEVNFDNAKPNVFKYTTLHLPGVDAGNRNDGFDNTAELQLSGQDPQSFAAKFGKKLEAQVHSYNLRSQNSGIKSTDPVTTSNASAHGLCNKCGLKNGNCNEREAGCPKDTVNKETLLRKGENNLTEMTSVCNNSNATCNNLNIVKAMEKNMHEYTSSAQKESSTTLEMDTNGRLSNNVTDGPSLTNDHTSGNASVSPSNVRSTGYSNTNKTNIPVNPTLALMNQTVNRNSDEENDPACFSQAKPNQPKNILFQEIKNQTGSQSDALTENLISQQNCAGMMAPSNNDHGSTRIKNSKHQEIFSEHVSYKMPNKETLEGCIKRKYYGDEGNNMEEKVLLLIGAAGSGKTTLLNFIANICFGVDTADENLVCVAPLKDSTKNITAYTFYPTKANGLTCTIIDTPGMNDSSGAEIKDHVQAVKTFVANIGEMGWHIHAVAFVAQAHLIRLTSSERMVMDYVNSIFGRTVQEHLLTFVTFSDNQGTPAVIEAMNQYNIKTKHYFMFNNACLHATNQEEIDDLDRVYWRVGRKAWKKCAQILQTMSALPVTAMKNVQDEIYNVNVLAKARKDLNLEFLCFFKLNREGAPQQQLVQLRECVWKQVSALYHLQHSTGSLEEFFVKICEENMTASDNKQKHMRVLALSSSSKLIIAAKSILQNHHNIIKAWTSPQVKQLKPKEQEKKNFIVDKNNAIGTFCYGCNEHHPLYRLATETGYMFKKTSSKVQFECKLCTCAGDQHGPIQGQMGFVFEIIKTSALVATKKSLEVAIEKYSCIDRSLTVVALLEMMVTEESDEEHKKFINYVKNNL